LGPEGVTASGQIEDAVAELATARLAIVPLQAGSGTRLKILEAWQARTPVVSTRLGAEGLPVEDGLHLRLADSPEEFAQAICALWSEHPARQRLATAGEKLLNARFTWPAIWAGLDHSGALY
jgi:glycosyltransferase involved in cell wall biosynthesis